MATLADNPFAVLTAVVAPAILTNACSVLALGTGNRIARVVDRTRYLISCRESLAVGAPEYEQYNRELRTLGTRSKLLLKALRLFYVSLGAFAASALIAVAGSAFTMFDLQVAFHA